MTHLSMIERFQCSGCVSGCDTTCGQFKIEETHGSGLGVRCIAQAPGTSLLPSGLIYLGLPRGFNKVGARDEDKKGHKLTAIRLWTGGTAPSWNELNVPVWAMEHEGFLFVRTYAPRTNRGYVDVIEGGSREMLVPKAIDVSTFYDEID